MFRKEDEKIPDISKELATSPVTSVIEEMDCFSPRRTITIEYSGPNIKQVVKRAPGILKKGMMITGTRTYIDDYFIDTTDPNNVVFHIFWHGIRDFDERTKMWGWIRLKHGIIHPDGTGSVVIEFYSKVVTRWSRGSLLQRSPLYNLLIKVYNYIFYDERRRIFIQECKEYEQNMIDAMKNILKLLETAKYPYP